MDFERIFRDVYPRLFRYLNRLTGSPQTADDVAQESFVRLLEKPLPEADAKRWLFTVATNLVRDQARAAKRKERLNLHPRLERSPAPLPDELAARGEAVAAVRRALDAVPERDRTMLLMRAEGFRYAEIGEVVGVATTSVGTLLARATKRFAEVYQKEAAGDRTP